MSDSARQWAKGFLCIVYILCHCSPMMYRPHLFLLYGEGDWGPGKPSNAQSRPAGIEQSLSLRSSLPLLSPALNHYRRRPRTKKGVLEPGSPSKLSHQAVLL